MLWSCLPLNCNLIFLFRCVPCLSPFAKNGKTGSKLISQTVQRRDKHFNPLKRPEKEKDRFCTFHVFFHFEMKFRGYASSYRIHALLSGGSWIWDSNMYKWVAHGSMGGQWYDQRYGNGSDHGSIKMKNGSMHYFENLHNRWMKQTVRWSAVKTLKFIGKLWS